MRPWIITASDLHPLCFELDPWLPINAYNSCLSNEYANAMHEVEENRFFLTLGIKMFVLQTLLTYFKKFLFTYFQCKVAWESRGKDDSE